MWNRVPPRGTQDALRAAFEAWGRPDRLRVDNGTPWGSRGDLPTDLVRWLAGLDIGVRANRPGRPQDNGVVERSQGTGKRGADPPRAGSVGELQAAIDRMDRIQRASYPHRGGDSRFAVYPGLRHSGRDYTLAGEPDRWRVSGPHALLAGCLVPRRVDRSGCVSVYNRNVYAGKLLSGRRAFVGFDPQACRWQVFDDESRLRNQREAEELTADRIQALEVTHRRDR